MTSFTRYLLIVFILLLPPSAAAQTTGIVSGIVSDETSGVLPGVGVTLRPDGTQTLLEAVTDGKGAYRFEAVPTGSAELTFRLINFSDVRRVVTVTPGGTAAANAVMLVAVSADIVITAQRTFRNLAEVENPAENLVGVAAAGSEGAITARQLAIARSTAPPKCWKPSPAWSSASIAARAKPTSTTCGASISITASTLPRPSPAFP